MVRSAADAKPGLADILAIYLGLELNTSKYGIYDPPSGLKHVAKSQNEAFHLKTNDPKLIANALVDEELPKIMVQKKKNNNKKEDPLAAKNATMLYQDALDLRNNL